MSPRAAAAQERYALIVSGVSGTEKFAASQKTWVSSLRSTLAAAAGVLGRSHHRAVRGRRRTRDCKPRQCGAHAGVVQVSPDGRRYPARRADRPWDVRRDKREIQPCRPRHGLARVEGFVRGLRRAAGVRQHHELEFPVRSGALGQESDRHCGHRLGRSEIRHGVSPVLHRSARPGLQGRQRQERPSVGVGGVRLCQPGREAGVRKAGNARHRAIRHRRQWRRRRQGGRGSGQEPTACSPRRHFSIRFPHRPPRIPHSPPSRSAASLSKPRSNSYGRKKARCPRVSTKKNSSAWPSSSPRSRRRFDRPSKSAHSPALPLCVVAVKTQKFSFDSLSKLGSPAAARRFTQHEHGSHTRDETRDVRPEGHASTFRPGPDGSQPNVIKLHQEPHSEKQDRRAPRRLPR